MNNDIVLKEVPPLHSDLMSLIDKLDNELLELCPSEGIFRVDFSDPKVHSMLFVVGYQDGTPVCCGGIRPLNDETVELKRFFVEKTCRKQGLASKVLAYLETKAKEKGHSLLKLETGPERADAIGFYKKSGFVEIPLFGEYIGSKYSICFEKRL
ncbi:GNAT family N-acetyltransferase [Acetanaerobacterium elongatum]|uniref:Acetyltransferase (GNAT) family protein n=1 Tax=Acetanaerobacterium elongatum TaxID=258515 RepID=A0A1H0FTG0_9FIRM|nr:GNAT family N-acetyltransferase [Acetanaerobacterium elongatum]SDN97930.1 Acetyltransferase (GNAT) family protein [Acetanaerobacterium elongatum]